MDSILDGFERLAQTVRFQAPKIPIVSTVTGSIVRGSGVIAPQYLARHARQPVKFYKALVACRVEGVADAHTFWLELGPDPACGSMVKATLGAMNVHSSVKSHESNWKTISATVATLYMAGARPNWCDLHHEYTEPLRVLNLPNNLELHHPVVASGDSKQILQISAEREPKTGHQVKIIFHLQDGSATQKIGGCQVNTYTSQEWENDWSKTSFFVKSRMDSLVESVKAGRGDHLRRSVIYELFASLVNYDPKYQAIEEMFWDEQTNDAVANVSLKPYNGCGNFECLPYWTDSLVHLAGFVLNVNLTSASDGVWLSGGRFNGIIHSCIPENAANCTAPSAT